MMPVAGTRPNLSEPTRRGMSSQCEVIFCKLRRRLAKALELPACEWMERLGEIQVTLSTVTALYPESLAHDGMEAPEE
jgi:hypothetical protein